MKFTKLALLLTFAGFAGTSMAQNFEGSTIDERIGYSNLPYGDYVLRVNTIDQRGNPMGDHCCKPAAIKLFLIKRLSPADR